MKKTLYLGLELPSSLSRATVDHFPLIWIKPKPLKEVRPLFQHMPQYTYFIFTSKSAVRLFCDFALQCGCQPDQYQNKICVSVGQATSRALLEAGFKIIFTAKEETAEGVVTELKKLNLSKAYLLWPHAAGSRNVIPSYLEEHSIPYFSSVLYETQTKKYSVLPNLDHYDELIFTSPSVVEAFIKTFGKIPAEKKITAIGPITKKYISNLDLNRSFIHFD